MNTNYYSSFTLWWLSDVIPRQWQRQNFHYFNVVMKWVLYPIVTATEMEKMGLMAEGVHIAVTMGQKNICKTRKHSSRMRTARLCGPKGPGGYGPRRGIGSTPAPGEQRDTWKNITFPQLCMRAVTNIVDVIV